MAVTVDTLPSGVTVESFSNVRASNPDRSPPEATLDTIAAGSSTTFSITYAVGSDVSGDQTVGITVEEPEAGNTGSESSTVAVTADDGNGDTPAPTPGDANPADGTDQASGVTYAFPGSVAYAGQDVYAYGPNITAGGSYELRSVVSFDAGQVEDSNFEKAVDVIPAEDVQEELGDEGTLNFLQNQDGYSGEKDVIEIEMGGLDSANYFVTGQNNANEQLFSDAELQRGDTFELAVQDLTAVLDDEDDLPLQTDSIDETEVELELDSNRGTYSLNASTGGSMDEDELFDLFTYADLLDGDATDNVNTNSEVYNIVDDNGAEITRIDQDGTIQYTTAAGDDQETDSVYQLLNTVDEDFPENNQITITGDEDAEYGYEDGNTFQDNEPGIGLFNVQLYDPDEEDADEKVLLRSVQDPEEDLGGVGIDEGTFDLQVDGIDTDASATASPQLEIAEEDVAVDFGQDVYTQEAGDLVRVTAELTDSEEAYIQLGSESSEFLDILYIEDDDDDDEVEFYINTRLLGTDLTGLEADAVYSDDDEVYSFVTATDEAGTGAFPDDIELAEPTFINGMETDDQVFNNGFQGYLEELNLIDSVDESPLSQLIRPMQPTDYELRATGDNIFYADNGESDLEEEDGFASLSLETPTLGDTTIHVGPEGNADDEEDVDELLETVSDAREDVAIDDLMVVRTEASGLYGMMTAISQEQGGVGFDAVDPNETEGFDASVLYALADDQVYPAAGPGAGDDEANIEAEGISYGVSASTPIQNQDANEIDLEESQNSVFVLPDNENNALYVVVDTDAEPFEEDLQDGTNFEASLEYETSDDAFEFLPDDDTQAGPFGAPDATAGDIDDPAYPYFDGGQSASSSAQFTFEDATAEFDNVQNDAVRISPSEGATISGTTNVAPGSDATVRVQQLGTENVSYLRTQEVNISEDGTFSAEFDFSDRSAGDQAEVSFRVRGDEATTMNGVFGEAEEEVPFTPSVSVDTPSSVAPGDTMEASVTAENTGDVAGDATLSISVAGEEQFSETVSLDGGASTSESVSYTVGEDASGSVSVSAEFGSASDSATVSVETEEPADNETDDEGGNGGTPGFGVAVAALALLSAALLARFRN